MLDFEVSYFRVLCAINVCFLIFPEKDKKKSKKKSLGEMQVKMKCEMEPSDELGKLDCKDWPLLFKVSLLIFFLGLDINFYFGVAKPGLT